MAGLADRGTGARSSRCVRHSAAAAYDGGCFLTDRTPRYVFRPCANRAAGLYSAPLSALCLRSASRLVAGADAVARLHRAAAWCEVQVHPTIGETERCGRDRT